MALIPPDAGIRMRMQTEANLLQPVAPVHEIPSDLPELRPGQTFTARIQEVLPDNTYKALVAGKQLTLQLPEGAKSGDMLDLMVIDRSPKVVIAKQVESGNTGAASGETGPYPFAKLSPAARLIGQLLPAEGETTQPAQLNRGQPLLAQPPQSQNTAAQLAPILAKAVSQSGLFYESHQAQWVSGKLPLEQLLQEPQGQRSSPAALAHAAATIASRSAAAEAPATANAILQNLQAAATAKVGAGETAQNVPAGSQATQPAALAQQVPDDLRPLVQHQLEAAGTQRMFWHGEIWPRQSIDWEIEWSDEREADGRSEEEASWRTALSLTTPRLGRIDASLQLTGSGVRIVLATPYGASAADLRDESPKLGEALAAAGVPLLAFQIKHENGPQASSLERSGERPAAEGA
jgi:hypothetical protein